MHTNRAIIPIINSIINLTLHREQGFSFTVTACRNIVMRWLRFLYKPRTAYQCTAFLTFFQFIAACNGFLYHRGRFIVNRWTKLYTIIFPIFINFCMYLCIQQVLHDPADSERVYTIDKLLLGVCVLELLASSCCNLLIAYSMLRNVRSHVELYDHIAALDQQLRRDFGANLQYHKLLLKNVIQTAILSTIYVAALCLTVLLAVPTRSGYTYAVAWFYAASNGGPHSICYLHSNLADMLRIRFRLIQKLLDADYLQVLFPQSNLRATRLQSLVDMVLAFHGIIDSINEVYRGSLMVGLTHDFMLVSTLLYLLFGHSMGERVDVSLFICGVMWLPVPLHKFLTAPIYCGIAVEEGKRCLRLIEQIDVCFPNFKQAKLIVNTTMHWRLENKIDFTCGLNMIYNRTIIAKITAVIFNYLLILIQFRMIQLMGEEIVIGRRILLDWNAE